MESIELYLTKRESARVNLLTEIVSLQASSYLGFMFGISLQNGSRPLYLLLCPLPRSVSGCF